jgi:hypothetical protein
MAALLLIMVGEYGHFYSPPIVVAFFLALSASALTYRFLGGSDGATFKLGPLQLTGTAAVFIGTLWFVNAQLATQMDVDNSPAKYQQARVVLSNLKAKVEELEADANSAKAKINVLTRENERLRSSADLGSINAIAGLGPDDDFAQKLIAMAKRHEGPWRSVSKERKVTVSVAGYLTGARAAACEDLQFRGQKVQIVSLLLQDGENIRSESPVSPESWERISAEFCGTGRQFDVQVSCAIASKLFTNRVLACRSDGEPAWKDGFRNLIPASAAVVYE